MEIEKGAQGVPELMAVLIVSVAGAICLIVLIGRRRNRPAGQLFDQLVYAQRLRESRYEPRGLLAHRRGLPRKLRGDAG